MFVAREAANTHTLIWLDPIIVRFLISINHLILLFISITALKSGCVEALSAIATIDVQVRALVVLIFAFAHLLHLKLTFSQHGARLW